ncbi:hypothetical protein B0H14DRAFT_2566542 [Mycena olivaceomarginata]|nr:hypothetical protein B0H14DRAFT_2566542 [Mycena olivaceomarginata]
MPLVTNHATMNINAHCVRCPEALTGTPHVKPLVRIWAGWGNWHGWSHKLLEQLDNNNSTVHLILHLLHILHILGPSSLTLYKYILGRHHILIYTLPPVKATTNGSLQQGRQCKEGISILGMVTLNDFDRLQREGTSGPRLGGFTGTTDTLFLEKSFYYNLIDLMTSMPNTVRLRPGLIPWLTGLFSPFTCYMGQIWVNPDRVQLTHQNG